MKNDLVKKGWHVTTIHGARYKVFRIDPKKGYLVSENPKTYIKFNKVWIFEMPNMGKTRKLKIK